MNRERYVYIYIRTSSPTACIRPGIQESLFCCCWWYCCSIFAWRRKIAESTPFRGKSKATQTSTASAKIVSLGHSYYLEPPPHMFLYTNMLIYTKMHIYIYTYLHDNIYMYNVPVANMCLFCFTYPIQGAYNRFKQIFTVLLHAPNVARYISQQISTQYHVWIPGHIRGRAGVRRNHALRTPGAWC